MSKLSTTFLICIFLALGCDSNVDVQVRLSLDPSCNDSGALSIPCSGRVGVWISDLSGVILEQVCVPYQERLDLSSLPAILEQAQVSFDGLPKDRDLILDMSISTDPFSTQCRRFADGAGVPELEPLVFGISQVVRLSADNAAFSVVLQCGQAVDQTCFSESIEIVASVDDLGNIGELGPGAEVGFGGVIQGQYTPLVSLGQTPEGWQGTVSPPPIDADCHATVVGVEGLEFLSCDATLGQMINARAYFLSPSFVEELSLVLNLFEERNAGILFGQVVSEFPVAGARVTSLQSEVLYLNEAMSGFQQEAGLASHGYFAARGECCADIVVEGGQEEPFELRSIAPTGAVPGYITLTRIDDTGF